MERKPTVERSSGASGRSRRSVLSALGSVAVATVAGCGGNTTDSDPSSSGRQEELESVAWPKVQSKEIQNWSQIDTRKQYLGKIGGVEIFEKTRIWENKALREAVKEKTAGQFDQTLAQFFATHLDLEGLTTGFADEEKIADEVAPGLRSQMEDAGIQNVEPVAPGDALPPHEGSVTREFAGHYKTPPFTRTTDIDGVGERTVELESQKLSVRGFATIWKAESGVAFASGGVVPAEDFEDQERITVTSEKNDGIDIILDIDLNLGPQQLRTEVADMASNVVRGSSSL